MAGEARQNVTRWIAEHYGYRAEDVARLASLFDDVDRRDAGGGGHQERRSQPRSRTSRRRRRRRCCRRRRCEESVEQALRAAALAPDATERIVAPARDRPRARRCRRRRRRVGVGDPRRGSTAALAVEERASRGYEALTRDTLQTRRSLRARLADVTGVERAIRRALERRRSPGPAPAAGDGVAAGDARRQARRGAAAAPRARQLGGARRRSGAATGPPSPSRSR